MPKGSIFPPRPFGGHEPSPRPKGEPLVYLEKALGFTQASVRLLSDVVRLLEVKPEHQALTERAIRDLLKLKSSLMQELRTARGE